MARCKQKIIYHKLCLLRRRIVSDGQTTYKFHQQPLLYKVDISLFGTLNNSINLELAVYNERNLVLSKATTIFNSYINLTSMIKCIEILLGFYSYISTCNTILHLLRHEHNLDLDIVYIHLFALHGCTSSSLWKTQKINLTYVQIYIH